MKENIEEVVERLEKSINDVCFSTTYSQEDKERDLQILLSDYKRLQKENLILRNQEIPYLKGEIKGYKERIKELKEENEELKYKYDRVLGDLVKSKQKVKDKIESYKGLKIIDKSAYKERIKPLIELLEEE